MAALSLRRSSEYDLSSVICVFTVWIRDFTSASFFATVCSSSLAYCLNERSLASMLPLYMSSSLLTLERLLLCLSLALSVKIMISVTTKSAIGSSTGSIEAKSISHPPFRQ